MRKHDAVAVGSLGGAIAGLIVTASLLALGRGGDSWIGFVGSIIGGAVGGLFTAAAGWLALKSVEKQIGELRRITNFELLEREANRRAAAALAAESLYSWIRECSNFSNDIEYTVLVTNVFGGLLKRAPEIHDIPEAISKAFTGIDHMLAGQVAKTIADLRDVDRRFDYDPDKYRDADHLQYKILNRFHVISEFNNLAELAKVCIRDGREAVDLFERYRSQVFENVRRQIDQ